MPTMLRTVVSRRPLSRALALLLLTAGPGCVVGPSALDDFSFSEGPGHVLRFYVADYVIFGTGVVLPACVGAGYAGISDIAVNVTLHRDGASWVGHPTSNSDGGFELRLQRGPGIAQFGTPVAGSMRGVATHSVLQFESPGTSAVFGEAAIGSFAELGGTVSRGFVPSGTALGAVAFTKAGASVSCTPGSVGWSFG